MKSIRADFLLQAELEFEWIRQFYIQGQAENFTATLLSIFHTARALGQQTPPLVLLAHGTRADSFHESFFEEFQTKGFLVETVSIVNHDKVNPEKHENPEDQDEVKRNVTTIFKISLPSYYNIMQEAVGYS